MNYLMVDISGKVLNYDIALCKALYKVIGSEIQLKFFAANVNPRGLEFDCKRLISCIPASMHNSRNLIKRGIKSLEGVLNYLYVVVYVLIHRVDVLHLQWLPFLEISSIEKIFLWLIKVLSPKTKLFLTVHNIYPHNSNNEKKAVYRSRFSKIQRFFDKYIIHLEVSRIEFCHEFSIERSRTCVIPHGIFVPENMSKIEPSKYGKKLNLIMYGNQSHYKGTDILVNALNLLSKDVINRVHTEIVGKISSDYYADLKNKTQGLDVEWVPEFVSNEILYKKIENSNVIVIPYREISQSGVLLLALSFNRAIIVSDLPSFRETLSGYPENMFFTSNDAQSLSDVIQNILNNKIDMNESLKCLSCLRDKYQWINIAKKYKELL